MTPLEEVQLRGDGHLSFRSMTTLESFYRFDGTIGREHLDGRMALVNARSGRDTQEWEVTAVPVVKGGSKMPSGYYSNAEWNLISSGKRRLPRTPSRSDGALLLGVDLHGGAFQSRRPAGINEG
jgi:hypothetical protein